MALYPTCVRCLSTDSEVDAGGVCTTCNSRLSGQTPAVPAPVPPPMAPADPAGTKTARPDDAPTVTGPHGDGSTAPSNETKPRPPLPEGFADYEIQSFIDRGGMGHVYKALHTKTGRVVALKLMSALALNDPHLRARFLTEGKALARLSHPGVVQVFDVGEHQGTPYIAMEYVPGGSLAKHLRAGPRPTPIEAAALMAEVASAIAAAHDKKILHRDIKPGNILLTEAGRPKLADFGLSSLFDETARMTNTGVLLGTPSFMSPEQAAGKFGDVGPRSDVYSLGATLYDVLTGKPPFTGDNAMNVVNAVIHDTYVPPRKRNPDVSRDLNHVVCRCLEKRQADRYETAAALANDLSRVARGEPIGRVGVLWFVKRFVRRNGKAMGAVAAILLLVLYFVTLKDRPRAGGSEAEFDARMAAAGTRIEDELKARKRVEIVGATGLPRYHRRFFGDAKLTHRDHQHGDQIAEFETNTSTCFDLCRDTMNDRFVVDAEIQHVFSRSKNSRVGIFLRGRDRKDVNRWTAVIFSDFFIGEVPPGMAKVLQQKNLLRNMREFGLGFSDRISVMKPHVVNINGNENQVRYPFTPENGPVNPFRKLRIDVRPEGLTVYWNINGTLTPVLTRPADLLRASDKSLQLMLNEYSPERLVPPWEPRSAVGIVAEEATVAFRNVWITPGQKP